MKKPTGNHVKHPFIAEAQQIQSLIEKKIWGAIESPSVAVFGSSASQSSADDDNDGDVYDSAIDEKENLNIRAACHGEIGGSTSCASSSSSSSSSISSMDNQHNNARNDRSNINVKKRKYQQDSAYDLKEATESMNRNLSNIIQEQLKAMKEEREVRSKELIAVVEALKESFVAAVNR